jgi:hypothetical protein
MSLMTLGDGAATEMFDAELQKLFANIDDPNTKPDAKRTLKLEVSFKPTKDRASSSVSITVTSKLVARNPHEGTAWLGYDIGTKKFVAEQHNPRQGMLFEEGEGAIPRIPREGDTSEEPKN